MSGLPAGRRAAVLRRRLQGRLQLFFHLVLSKGILDAGQSRTCLRYDAFHRLVLGQIGRAPIFSLFVEVHWL